MQMKFVLIVLGAVMGMSYGDTAKEYRLVTPRERELTGFQENDPYEPRLDVRNDFAMVYGISNVLRGYADAWIENGYVPHMMTGIAWGGFDDFKDGQGNGIMSLSQVEAGGERVLHGHRMPYLVPSVAFSDYVIEGLKKAVDRGIVAIHLEEPEFWAHAGFSKAFQREWELYYREPYVRPDTNVDSQYKASKLKSYLYTRAIRRVAEAVREYAKAKHGREVRFYVPTHSLINYTQWKIVSPQSSLVDLPVIDGFIAQIWTGTSRTPNVYEGVRKERTFETAFLEYGVMQELIRKTGRRMWFLHDPIEDNPRYDWEDYRFQYKETVAASLLHPKVWRYEICPWIERVLTRSYPRGSKDAKPIPADYLTTLGVVFNQLRDMEQADVEWSNRADGVGVFVADSGMFQRAEPVYRLADKNSKDDDKNLTRQEVEDWSSFYGLALPLVKVGVPARPVQLDNVSRFAGYLDEYKVLVLSYEFIKPAGPGVHHAIAEWVGRGGSLVYVGADTDPFHKVREWWNTGVHNYASPAGHLLETLGLDAKADGGVYASGKGKVWVQRRHPAYYSRTAKAAGQYRDVVRQAFEAAGGAWHEQNFLQVRRGPYIIAACMDESVSTKPVVFEGQFLDLFDPTLEVQPKVEVKPGQRAWLMDLDRIRRDTPEPVAAAGRFEKWQVDGSRVSFEVRSAKGVNVVSRIVLPGKPKSFTFDGAAVTDYDWHAATSTLRWTHAGRAEAIAGEIQW